MPVIQISYLGFHDHSPQKGTSDHGTYQHQRFLIILLWICWGLQFMWVNIGKKISSNKTNVSKMIATRFHHCSDNRPIVSSTQMTLAQQCLTPQNGPTNANTLYYMCCPPFAVLMALHGGWLITRKRHQSCSNA